MRFLAWLALASFTSIAIYVGVALAEAARVAVSERDLLALLLDPQTGLLTFSLVLNGVFFRAWRESEKGRIEDARNHSNTLLKQQGVLEKVSLLLDRVDRGT